MNRDGYRDWLVKICRPFISPSSSLVLMSTDRRSVYFTDFFMDSLLGECNVPSVQLPTVLQTYPPKQDSRIMTGTGLSVGHLMGPEEDMEVEDVNDDVIHVDVTDEVTDISGGDTRTRYCGRGGRSLSM